MECGQWGTVKESELPASPTGRQSKTKQLGGTSVSTTTLQEIAGKNIIRTQTTIAELDRVLGGGMVPGSLILLSGEPGIGKSTLALMWAVRVPHTLYISGEESVEQIKLRADRLGLSSPTLALGNATSVEDILTTIRKQKPALVIIDSVQTMRLDTLEGEAGAVTQIRASTATFLDTAKSLGVTIVLIGHVTKDGTVAGPKTLEHLVDTVLSFVGDQHHGLRILRSAKNRFGGTDEVGIFEMREDGLRDVPNPSQILLAERGEGMPGSVVTSLLSGSRPMLVEIQALVNKTVFGYPVRKANGFDINRLHMLIAVLERRAGVQLGQYDIHVNVVGGLDADEPAADLAVALAIASAYKDKALGSDLVVFGEVGLGGEVRSVRQAEKRIKECEHLGMKRIILAKHEKISSASKKIHIIPVANIQELIRQT